MENDGCDKETKARLDAANAHFRKRAAQVFGDDDSVRLLAWFYRVTTVNIADFDFGERGLAFARLTAANFCEIGAKSIYITEPGQLFIDAINDEAEEKL